MLPILQQSNQNTNRICPEFHDLDRSGCFDLGFPDIVLGAFGGG